jgi:hypothetical protein
MPPLGRQKLPSPVHVDGRREEAQGLLHHVEPHVLRERHARILDFVLEAHLAVALAHVELEGSPPPAEGMPHAPVVVHPVFEDQADVRLEHWVGEPHVDGDNQTELLA